MSFTENGINTKTDELFRKIPNSKRTNNDFNNLNRIYSELNIYTLAREEDDSPLTKEMFKYITPEKKESHYNDGKYDFKFCLLSDFFMDEKLKDELTSDKRFHKCHESSINLALDLPFKNVFVVTGYVNTGDKDILHSVVEIDGDDEVMIDYTQNILMKKEDYLKINCFREISRVRKEDLQQEIDTMTDLKMTIPYYLFFRDEMKKDLNKNKKILSLHD